MKGLRFAPALIFLTVLGAQTPPLDSVKSYLGLQDSQMQSLQQLRQQQFQAVHSALSELATKQQSLREQLDRGSTDAAALGKLLLEIEGVRKRIAQTQQSYVSQALNVLTAEQKSKLAALEQALKLEVAARQAVALGLLAPPEPEPGVPAPRWFGPGSAGAAPRMGPRGLGTGPGATPLRQRVPRSFPPLEE